MWQFWKVKDDSLGTVFKFGMGVWISVIGRKPLAYCLPVDSMVMATEKVKGDGLELS